MVHLVVLHERVANHDPNVPIMQFGAQRGQSSGAIWQSQRRFVGMRSPSAFLLRLAIAHGPLNHYPWWAPDKMYNGIVELTVTERAGMT